MKYTVYYKTELKPTISWRYKANLIELVQCNKKIIGALYILEDGLIRKQCKDGLHKKRVPANLITDKIQDNKKVCKTCKQVFSLDCFVNAHSVRTSNATKSCSKCRQSCTERNNSVFSAVQIKKRYILNRRIEIIKKNGGCSRKNCPINKVMSELSDEMLCCQYEFNHIDDTKKLCTISNYLSFTDKKAKEHGFSSWKDFWESEVAKCEVLCVGHHAKHTRNLIKTNRNNTYKQIN